MDDADLDRVHALALRLTGDGWCPYPGDLFVEVVLSVSDDIARELVLERRKYLFPTFFCREPMFETLKEIQSNKGE